MSKPPQSKLDEHALALGHVCIAWGHLEEHLDMLIKDLLFAEPPGNPASGNQWQAAQCVTANTDMRDKVQITLALGYLRRPDEIWFDKLKSCLDGIDNELRTQRNRMLHDIWIPNQIVPGNIENVLRVRTQGTKIRRPQAFQRELVTREEIPVTAAEIWKLRNKIRDATTMIVCLWGNYLHPGSLPWS
jgi:hypothetical protein